jgi:hypothetical protein
MYGGRVKTIAIQIFPEFILEIDIDEIICDVARIKIV